MSPPHRLKRNSACEPQGTGHRDWPKGHVLSLPSLAFSSCYVYSPRAFGAACAASRQLCERVKASDPGWLPRYAGLVYRASLCDPQLANLFGGAAVLVPIPGSAPGRLTGWPASQLAFALREVGLGQCVWKGLRRQSAVTKSATARARERPTVREHYESFVVERPLPAIQKILLVDDVITKGRTLLAAAVRLHEQFPHADVRAFALVRTLGFVPRVDQLVGTCHGVVRWAGGDARREP
jgi:hypothetical protein